MARPSLNLTPLGYGTFKIGRNRKIKYPQDYELPSDAEAERILKGVLDLGIRYIDTAPAYGLSEERIGRFLAHRRDEFTLSTKVGERFDLGESTYAFDAASITESVETSLRRLKRDAVDLLFIHAHRDDVAVLQQTDAVETLHSLRDRGLAVHIGFSGYTEAAFRAALDWADALMLEYHPNHRELEPVIDTASERGLAVVVKKPLASGTLAPGDAIPFLLENSGVRSAVVGGLSLDHLRQNVSLAESMRGRMPHSQSRDRKGAGHVGPQEDAASSRARLSRESPQNPPCDAG